MNGSRLISYRAVLSIEIYNLEVIVMANRVPVQETYPLPSGDRLYAQETKGMITLRPMTTMEEKLRLSSTNSLMALAQIVQNCVITPQDFDVNELKMFDLDYLIYKLRVVTYGPTYTVSLKCPDCGHVFEQKISLDDIPVNELPEDFVEPFEIGPMPVSGDVVGCRLLSYSDYLAITRESKRILAKMPDYVGDPEFILKWTRILKTLNGKDFKVFEIQKYVENLHAADFQYLDQKYAKVVGGLGQDLSRVDLCPNCGGNVNYNVPIRGEFFRPKY